MTRVSSLRPVSGTAGEILGLLREWDAADDPGPLVIATSGSTGTPKRVVLSRDAMRASALATQERLGGPGQWVLNLPPAYVAGVQVLYRSVVAGTEPVVTTDVVSAREQLSGRSYTSLVPTQLHRLLEEPAAVQALAAFDAVLVGGGPMRQQDLGAASKAGITVVSTYGMSETCGGCVYDGRPLAGVEVEIDEHDQILLRGPMLFEGYEGDPGRTAAALRDDWFHTDDLGRIGPDGRLEVFGRGDDVIISGGVKVPAAAVARMLEQHPDVSEAHVVGVPDDEWGQRVVAAIHGDASLAELRDLVTPREWAPKQVVAVDFPRLENGKPDREEIRRQVLEALA